ncbi:MAG: cell wall-binding repeat-containing protein, partial [Coriobacteriales bacterium]|nr:cell wall-binding repeat-containing protein [Coriobacteriales bacterium]
MTAAPLADHVFSEPENSSLTYQWYQSTERSQSMATAQPLTGETDSTYTPPVTTNGASYYFCRVTNTWTDGEYQESASAFSTPILISVFAAGTAAGAVSVKTQSADTETEFLEKTELSVQAEVAGTEGTLSYQWYRNVGEIAEGTADEDIIADAKPLYRATNSSYEAPTLDVGEAWYFCVVTNTVALTEKETTTTDVVKVTVAPSYSIGTPQKLMLLADDVAVYTSRFAGITVYLTEDIDLSGVCGPDVGPAGTSFNSVSASFLGNFDGGYHTISGYYVSSSETNSGRGGLFHKFNGGVFENVFIEGSIHVNAWIVGSLIDDTVSAPSTLQVRNVGADVDITNAYNSSVVYTGGIVGRFTSNVSSTVINCYNHGDVTATGIEGGYTGGIVGGLNDTERVTGCYNSGDITGGSSSSAYVGGIVGRLGSGSLTRSYNSGAVSKAGTGNNLGPLAGDGAQIAAGTECYYLSSTAVGTVRPNTTAVPAEELEGEAFPARLGPEFRFNPQGFPQLAFEQGAGWPVITTQPQSSLYAVGAEPDALSVGAALPKRNHVGWLGKLSYQWYSNSEKNYDGATATGSPDLSSLAPDTTGPSVTYYFCEVTNTYAGSGNDDGEEKVLTDIVTIVVLDGAPAKPLITTQPQDMFVQEATTPDTPLRVVATQEAAAPGITVQGRLDYQWYANRSGLVPASADTAPEADRIAGATSSDYTPVVQGVAGDEIWYYCVVTTSFAELPIERAVSSAACLTLTPCRILSTPADLLDFANEVNGSKVVGEETLPANAFAGRTIELAADLDLSQYPPTSGNWTPIGRDYTYYFSGIFEGNGHSITGLSFSGEWRDAPTGFFGRISGATIRNLKLEGSMNYTSGSSSWATGLLVGTDSSGSTFSNVEIDGTISITQAGAKQNIALGVGMAGSGARFLNVVTRGSITITGTVATHIAGIAAGSATQSALFANCGNEAGITVTATSTSANQYIAGVGSYGGSFTGCYNTGNITVASSSTNTNNMVAGVCGGTVGSSSFSQCYNTGSVTGPYYAAGITQGSTNNVIRNCYNTGTISSTSAVAGVVAAINRASVSSYYSTNNYSLVGCVDREPPAADTGESRDADAFRSPGFLAELNNGTASYITGTDSPRLAWELGNGAPSITGETLDEERITAGGDPDTAALTVTAVAPTDPNALGAGGVLSYQWYRSTNALNNYGTKIAGADEKSYEWTATLADTPGWHYFYCVVTNRWGEGIDDFKRTTSSIFSISLITTDTVWKPVFATEPRDTWYVQSDEGVATTALSVDATPPENTDGTVVGEITYQWYRSTTETPERAEDITKLWGEEGTSYTPPITTLGTTWYFCEATNTYQDSNAVSTNSAVVKAVVWSDAQAAPVISVQPEPRQYLQNAAGAEALSVTAERPAPPTVGSEGTLSYQWYYNTDGSEPNPLLTETNSAVSGVLSSPAFTPATNLALDSYYYYCVVTNTFDIPNPLYSGYTVQTISDTALVALVSETEAAKPVVDSSALQEGASYRQMVAPASLSITADLGGATAGFDADLSYQWYSNTTGDVPASDPLVGDVPTPGDVKIPGATGANYVPPATLTLGTTHYYCLVTNTFEKVKTQSTASTLAAITINPLVQIYTAQDFKNFANAVTASATPAGYYSGYTVSLEADIDLAASTSTNPWTPIGTNAKPFTGTFDGKGHTISGLHSTATGTGGIFDYVSGATIENFVVKGALTSSATSISGLVAHIVEYPYPTAPTIIRKVGSEVDIFSTSDSAIVSIGGIIASYSGVGASIPNGLYITGCYFKGEILTSGSSTSSGNSSGVGGIIGSATDYVFIDSCYNDGDITGHGPVGGIIGSAGRNYPNNSIANSYNSGTVLHTLGGNQEYMGAITGKVGSWSETAKFSNLYYLEGSCWQGSVNSEYTEPEGGGGVIQVRAASELSSAAQVALLNATQSPGPWVAGDTYPALAWEKNVVPVPDRLTITLSSFVKNYGETDPVFTYTVQGLKGKDRVTGLTITRAPGDDAGSYSITGSHAIIEGEGENPPASYPVTYLAGTLTIKALNLSAEGFTLRGINTQGYAYTGSLATPQGITVAREGTVLTPGKDYTLSYASSIIESQGTVTATGKGNYQGQLQAGFTINPVPLTITVDAKEKAFGAADPVFTCRVSGLKGADRLASITLTRTPGEEAGSYNITARAAVIQNGNVNTIANYTITYVKGTLTIRVPEDKGPEDEVPDTLEEHPWPRLDGGKGESGGRYDTMQAIVGEGWDISDYVIVASGANFPDALAASSLAGIYDAPVVLTATDTLTTQAEETIRSLGAKRAYVIGGPAAVSDATLALLETVVGTGKVSRIYGDGRIETALDIYEKGKIPEGGNTSWGNTAIIANGFS